MGVFSVIVDYLERGSGGVLATVARRTGSAPRDVGAKMFVGDDGTMLGTVGGGRLEADAYAKAMEMMGRPSTVILSINMEARTIEDPDMLCGGNVDILLEPVTIRHLELYRSIKECREKREPAVLFTRFGAQGFAKALLRKDGTILGDLPDDNTVDQRVLTFDRREPELTGDFFIEPIRVIVPLYIFGAGHVSQCLARIAKITDFYVTVIDDRKEFANMERFHDADSVIVGAFRDTFCALEFTGNEYAVICTRSHEYDALVLEEVLQKQTKYVGMIGSSRKVKIIMDRLREKGFHDSITGAVHTPIGIAIDAETPQEIAVSIVAEMIKVKNQKHPDKNS
jgi:xanthine dehydrogenase accessory factor